MDSAWTQNLGEQQTTKINETMKKILTVIVMCALAQSSWGALSYDQNITAIFGSGNPDTGWTTDSGSGITLGLRAKGYDTADTSNVNGTYSFATGFAPSHPATRAAWNWEFSINSGTALLPTYDYFVGIDTDPSAGISYGIVNPFTKWTDNSYGDSSTANGAGVEASPDTQANSDILAAANSIAQQSQNLVFAGGNPLVDGTYNYEIYAVEKGAGANGTRLADSSITVVVGRGGSSVPDGGSTIALLGAAFAGIAGLRRKFIA